MKQIAALALSASILSACATSPRHDGATLYYGFSLVDPVRERVSPIAWLTVRDGKILSVGEGVAPKSAFAERRDMTGTFATPGLIDTHAHVTLGPISLERTPVPALRVNFDSAYTEHSARMLLAHGVTTIRNPAGDADINVAYRTAAATGATDGPEALVAGPVIDRSAFPFHGLSELTDDAHPIEAIVNRQADKGIDYVKLYHGLTEGDVARAVAVAKTRGVPTIGHVGISWKKAAELGVDALVHATPASADDLEPEKRDGYRKLARQGSYAFFEWWEAAELDGPVMQDVVRTLSEKRVHVDLTLIAFKLAFWGDVPAIRDGYIALSHPALAANWNAGFRFDLGWNADDYARAKAVWPKILNFARMLHEAGVPMTLGTDQANPYVAPGASLVQEMKLHEEAGIGKWDVLRMATSDAAAILKIDTKTGRIADGLDADVVFTSADPTISFDAYLSPTLVLNNGRSYDPAELKAKQASMPGK